MSSADRSGRGDGSDLDAALRDLLGPDAVDAIHVSDGSADPSGAGDHDDVGSVTDRRDGDPPADATDDGTDDAADAVEDDVADHDADHDAVDAEVGGGPEPPGADLPLSIDVPRLPPRALVVDRPDPWPEPVPDAIRASHRQPRVRSIAPLGARPDVVLHAFREPELVPTDRPDRVLLLSRVAVFAWAMALTIAVFIARSHLGEDGRPGRYVTLIGWIGLGVGAAIIAAGWWWSDVRIRNIHLLDGRRPGRLRAATAWLTPAVACGLLAATIVRAEPTELFDVRPSIIVAVFVAAMWRPAALVRRILTSLSRLRSDALIGATFVLDASAFGLLWWRLDSWSPSLPPTGSVDAMLGVAGAATVALGVNVVVWAMLVESVGIAQAHRLTALRTRHEHRLLRLQGVDPSDPEVWWELVRRRMVERHERTTGTAEDATAPDGEVADASPSAADGERTDVAALVDSPGSSTPVEPALDRVETAARHDGTDRGDATEGADDDAAVRAATDVFVARLQTEHRSAFLRLGPEQAARVAEQLRRQIQATPELLIARPDRERELRARFAAALGGPAAPTARGDDPLASLRRRLGLDTIETDDDPIQLLVEQASQVQIDAALRGPGARDGHDADDSGGDAAERAGDDGDTGRPAGRSRDERLVLPRLYSLEAARWLVVLAAAATTAAFGWLVMRTFDAAAGPIGLIDQATLDQLAVPRRAAVSTLSILLALVPLWVFAVLSHAERAGVPVERRRWSLVAFVVASSGAAVAQLLDGNAPDRYTAIYLVVAGAIAIWQVREIDVVQRWFALGTGTRSAWVACLFLLLGVAATGRLLWPILPSAKLDDLTFFAVVETLTAGILVVVVALCTVEVEDTIRRSPELAVGAAEQRHRR